MNGPAQPAVQKAAANSPPRPRNAVFRFLRILGPGLITGASDDDPSGIGTYAVAGAQLGYAPLWTALVTYPLMAAVQLICARIGLVSGRGLAGVLRRHYPRWLLYAAVVTLLASNTINAGVDVGAIAAGINLFVPVPAAYLIVPIAVSIVVLQIWGSYRFIARVFKWLTLSLFAYVASALLARPEWADVLRGSLIPTLRLDTAFLATLVAILGTTISPYLFFWQASQEVEEELAQGRRRIGQRRGATDHELSDAAWDVNAGMLFSNVVMYFIILASAATLHQAGRTDIQTAAEAAEALRPLAGNAATVLMALGLIGTGVLAVPILTGSSAYAVCEAFERPLGLDKKLRQAKGFYAVIAGSTVAGLFVNYVGISPLAALFWTAVLNGLLAPPLLVVIMLVGNNRAVMGERVNGRALNILGWIAAILMSAAAVGLLLTWGA